MSALIKERKITNDINLVYHLSEKPNNTQLKAHQDRAVVAKLRADLVLPNDTIMTVDIDFDNTSDYHNNVMMIMDEFGMEMLANAFEHQYGVQYSEKIRHAWANKQNESDPRKPTYLLVQKPEKEDDVPHIYVACGSSGKDHKPNLASSKIF